MTASLAGSVSHAAHRSNRRISPLLSILLVPADPRGHPGSAGCFRAVGDCLAEKGWRIGRFQWSTSARGRRARWSPETEMPPAPAGNFVLARRLTRLAPRYDIIHLFFSSGMSFSRQIAPSIVLARFLGKRVVLSYHRNQAEAELEQAGRWMLPLLKLCDRIVVTSRPVADLFARRHLTAEVIPAAIDQRLFRPRRIDCVQPKIVIARSLEKRNNVICAIEAFVLVKRKYPRAEMVIVGDGSQRRELERPVTREKLNGVSFSGWVSRSELSRLFAEADVYVNASSIDDLPTSLLEALAIGLPIVTTAVGGIPDVISDGVNGLIVRSNNPAALADRIIELVESPELVQRLSEQAKLSAEDYFLDRVKGKWADMYHDIAMVVSRP